MRQLVAVALLGALGCAPSPGETAKRWTTKDFFARRGVSPEPDLGGWTAADLVGGNGSDFPLRVQPGFSNGASAGFIITEIWKDHPLPWLQPVYVVVTTDVPNDPGAGRPRDETGKSFTIDNIFPVDVAGTFYSPFWLNQFAFDEKATAASYHSATSLLNAGLPTRTGSMVLCPIVPPDTSVALGVGVTTPVRPYTGTPLAKPGLGEAFVDGRNVFYLKVGPKRADWHDDVVEEAPMYVFVTSTRVNGQDVHTRLPIPVVLPDEALTHSLLRRVDVVLPASAGVFVPDQLADQRAELERSGVNVPAVAPGIPDAVAKEFALRVAGNPDCFTDATFPATCKWWDHEASFEYLGGQPTGVVLTAITLAPVTP
jgi:hypothetical protein